MCTCTKSKSRKLHGKWRRKLKQNVRVFTCTRPPTTRYIMDVTINITTIYTFYPLRTLLSQTIQSKMSNADQPHLNGAYYGPSIPPPTKKPRSYNRPSRGGGGCNPFSWCFSCLCGCIFNLIIQILITILVLLGIAVLVFWLIFRPNAPKFHVNDATLTEFTLSPDNNTLYYNLAVNMTFRNPNKRIGIYYDKIEANAEYHDQRFSTRDLDRFYLGHKKEHDLSTVFSGEQLVVLGNGDRSKYDSEKNDGVYNIDLKLKLRIRLKVGWAKPKFKPKFECDLKVPITAGGTVASGGFQRTKCDFDW